MDLKLEGRYPGGVNINILATKVKLSVKSGYSNLENQVIAATSVQRTEIKIKVKHACQLAPFFVFLFIVFKLVVAKFNFSPLP